MCVQAGSPFRENKSVINEIQAITFRHTSKVLGDQIGLVFYNYSKDGKHQHSQMMIGLAISTDGIPNSLFSILIFLTGENLERYSKLLNRGRLGVMSPRRSFLAASKSLKLPS